MSAGLHRTSPSGPAVLGSLWGAEDLTVPNPGPSACGPPRMWGQAVVTQRPQFKASGYGPPTQHPPAFGKRGTHMRGTQGTTDSSSFRCPGLEPQECPAGVHMVLMTPLILHPG